MLTDVMTTGSWMFACKIGVASINDGNAVGATALHGSAVATTRVQPEINAQKIL